jgi:hypothetical protein
VLIAEGHAWLPCKCSENKDIPYAYDLVIFAKDFRDIEDSVSMKP